MKHWEEAALLTDVLDRHAAHLTQGFSAADWTLYHHVERFLVLLGSEPILAELVQEYRAEADAALKPLADGLKDVFERAERLVKTLAPPKELASADGERVLELAQDLRYARKVFHDSKRGAQALERLAQRAAHFPKTLDACRQLQARHRALAFLYERLSANLPGVAYLRIRDAVVHSEYAIDGEPEAVEEWNQRASKLQGYIRESSLWRGMSGELPQPGVVEIQDSVRTLHLALVTSLARGRSRWAMVKRFAARCESLDRQRLQAALDRSGQPEGLLTLEFARYLFDAGYNPLVDAAACGLRPDVLDATAEPAIYVEAKQYERVRQGTAKQLEEALAQTLNTWARLSKRWNVPEAFLLVFRRSGRPLEFENPELRVSGGRLYVLCVDLADAEESGSRAEPAVRIDLKAILGDAMNIASPEQREGREPTP
jgi:hypothetical protein